MSSRGRRARAAPRRVRAECSVEFHFVSDAPRPGLRKFNFYHIYICRDLCRCPSDLYDFSGYSQNLASMMINTSEVNEYLLMLKYIATFGMHLEIQIRDTLFHIFLTEFKIGGGF